MTVPDDSQRDQKKLNSEGGRGDQWVSSRVFALDEFVHEWEYGRAVDLLPEPCKFYHLHMLTVNRRRVFAPDQRVPDGRLSSRGQFSTAVNGCWFDGRGTAARNRWPSRETSKSLHP